MVNVTRIGLDIVEFICLVGYLLYTYVDALIKQYILPVKLKSLQGEIILVTGAGRGIGRGICLELAESGATIVCWSKTAAPLQEVADEIKKRHGHCYTYTVDVSNRAEVQRAAALVREQVGEVSIVINNAGLMTVKPFLDTTPEDIESLFQVNVFANFWMLREFLPGMIERGKGHIVSVCSASGILPTRNIVTYSSTKHAVHGYMEALRDELRHHPRAPDIKLTTAFPFYCNTEMLENSTPNTRFPYFMPIVTPDLVAKRVIRGIQQETEYIYTPVLVGWLAMFSWLVPPKSLIAFCDFVQCNIDPLHTNHRKEK